ncbi:MAG: GHKL domain-containing protein [Planctomycetes bacterium]|nr:GHKL domain-containing protein [Planctomycetota bacterium]
MEPDQFFQRYLDLQRYVGWTHEDAERIREVAGLLEPHFAAFVDDFYAEIERHPEARKVITGGAAQIARLKGTLTRWLQELLAGCYDADYVARRWRVGWRHVEIGLSQVYANAALSRLRGAMLLALEKDWPGNRADSVPARRSLNMLLDLDLAIIEDAYQTEFQRRQMQTERLATIGQVAGGVAHELRNPLNVVKTSIYFLLNAKNISPEKLATHLQRIDRQVEMADGVITALNNFARLPIPDLQPQRIDSLLQEVLDLNALSPDVQIQTDWGTPSAEVLGDRQQLKIVFGNLIRNAREAMPDGGALRISARRAGKDVHLVFEDTGTGIRKEDLSRVTEPLFSTKSRGIGLGLSITRAILEKHNGRLTVASEPGRGTVVTVVLAAAAERDVQSGSEK